MATSSTALDECTRFSVALGNEKLLMELDTQQCQLAIEVFNASSFVVHKKIFSKPEDIREITGKWLDSIVCFIVIIMLLTLLVRRFI